MNAVKRLISSPERIENIGDMKDFVENGVLTVTFKNLTDQEEEDLAHLRISNINGVIFDDRKTRY